jgi:hypothetical protein
MKLFKLFNESIVSYFTCIIKFTKGFHTHEVKVVVKSNQ